MKTVFVYPGQGSQFVQMGRFLYDAFDRAKILVEEASDTLGFSFSKLLFEDPNQDLNKTQFTQPALLCVSTLYDQVLRQELAIEPAFVAGHSVGEYAAMVAVKSLSYADALRAVFTRGQAMQEAVPQGVGGMAALLGVTSVEAQDLCNEASKQDATWVLEPANYNGPGQIVVSGHLKAISALKELLENPEILDRMKLKKLRLIPLNVSAPFHCTLMLPAENRMRDFLAPLSIQDSPIPVVQNVDAKAYQKGADLRENLIRQISRGVKWQDTIENLKLWGVDQFIEVGAGKTLTGLIKKICPEVPCANAQNLEEFKALAKLFR